MIFTVTVLVTLVSSSISLLILFLLCRLIGQRQIGQMSMFDYINSICIGSTAMELAIHPEEWRRSLTAMLVYGLATALINIVTCKNLKLRKILNGKPLILFEGGNLYRSNLYRAKLDVNEFLTQCRIAGYFDLAQLEAVILETSGHLSFLPRDEFRPVCPEDLQMHTAQQHVWSNLIQDGQIMQENLKASGQNEVWLKQQLHSAGIGQISEVFLAMYTPDGKFCAYRMLDEPRQDHRLI